MSSIKKTTAELREFAFVVGTIFAIIGGLMLWRHKEHGFYLVAGAGVLLFFGLVAPRLLAPVEWAWMKLAHVLSIVMTFVIVTLTFYLVVTPIGLFLRLTKKDLLGKAFDKSKETYWIPVEVNGPGTRPFTPY